MHSLFLERWLIANYIAVGVAGLNRLHILTTLTMTIMLTYKNMKFRGFCHYKKKTSGDLILTISDEP